jgi:UDP-N-acetylmuramoyl-tripeptide--D-alanyl-D-alanine ligase
MCEFDTPEGRLQVTIPAPGHHIALDAAAALAVALSCGVELSKAASALALYTPVGMRLRVEPLLGGGIALNDAYNANPDSVAASVSLLGALDGHRVAVLGDMLELGPDESKWHESTIRHADGVGVDLLVLVGPRMSTAAAAAAATPCLAFPDPLDAVEPVRAALQSDSRVLFKGSRGTRVERILHELRPEEDR